MINVQAWNESYHTFENQVEEFNKKIQTSTLDINEIDKIYEIVKREVSRLQELAEIVKAKEEEIEKGGCCALSSKAIWTLTLLNGVSKICAIAGVILSIAAESNPTAKWIGVGIFAVGEIFDSATTIYDANITLKGEKISDLVKINKEGAEHALIFKKFLKRLKKIKHMEQQIIEQNRSSSDKNYISNHVIINIESSKILDEWIGECLREYSELSSRYRRDDIYCRITSLLIQALPLDDPLRIGLIALEPSEGVDISILASNPLPIHYLPICQRKSSLTNSKYDEQWSNEKAKLNEDVSSIEEIDPLQIKTEKSNDVDHINESQEKTDSIQKKIEYAQRLAYYKFLVAQRFKTNREITFFDTPNGWRIDSQEGVTRT